MVHRDFHTGNILAKRSDCPLISDLGLCGKVDDTDKTQIYGVMPYVAPEVLRGKLYTQASDIYDALDFKYYTSNEKQRQHYEIENQFKEAEKYRKTNLSSFGNNQITHP